MQRHMDVEELYKLSKEQLVVELVRAREAINELVAESATLRRQASGTSPTSSPRLAGSSTTSTPAAAAAAGGVSIKPSASTAGAVASASGGAAESGEMYTVSLNVLNITGSARQRVCKSVPLQAILSRNNQRDDEREADTPVVGGGSHPRFSVEMGRFSGFSIGSVDVALPDDLSPCRTDGRPSEGGGRLSSVMTSSPEPAPQQAGAGAAAAGGAGGGGPNRRNRPAPLLHVAGPLDTNSILSMNTLHAFRALQQQAPLSPIHGSSADVMHYIMDVFAKKNNFRHHEDPMYVEGLGRAMLSLCSEIERVVRDEPAHPTVPSPAYVFGDIHGNFKDLYYFTTQLMIFDDLRFVPFRFLFLGDYVDRGDFSVETVAFLFALKAFAPHKVTLLRGNHEDTLVNGDRNLYGATSFRSQSIALFGEILGEKVWSRCNDVFSHLPLTANIDKKIFCTHGGLPRYSGGPDKRYDFLHTKMPPMRSFFEIPANESAEAKARRMAATDVCWSDPAEDENRMDKFGFGNNPRGNGVIMFGSTAVEQFLETHGFEYIFRAHQEKADGLKISKNARVVTIFSTSAYVGHQNGAGVVYVGDNRIRLIVKEPDAEDTDGDDDEEGHYRGDF